MHTFLGILGVALAMGLGCGSTCGSAASAFLLGYMVTSEKGRGDSFWHMFAFYSGKCLMVVALCIGSSVLGYTVIHSGGTLSEERMSKLMPVMMLISAGWLLWKLFSKGEHDCTTCKSCNTTGNKKSGEKVSIFMFFGMGCAYGATPCAPLLLILGYSVLLSAGGAAFLGLFFSIASCVVPFIMLLSVGGFLSGKAMAQLGKYWGSFQNSIYCFLMLAAMVMLIQ